MADGMWTLHDDGSFELQEPYATMLQDAKVKATMAWADALIGYLFEHTGYEPEFLKEELLRRNREKRYGPVEIADGFILDALSGDL